MHQQQHMQISQGQASLICMHMRITIAALNNKGHSGAEWRRGVHEHRYHAKRGSGEACTTNTACWLTSHQTLSLAACAEADASRPTEMAAVANEAMASCSSMRVLKCSCWAGVGTMRKPNDGKQQHPACYCGQATELLCCPVVSTCMLSILGGCCQY